MMERTQTRRALLTGAVATTMAAVWPKSLYAFGEEGAFNPRILITGTSEWGGRRRDAPRRWAQELVRRTSAPARMSPTTVRADAPELLSEPFAIWAGSTAPEPLTVGEVRGLRHFISLGGTLFVDESDPQKGAFSKAAAKQVARVLPQGSAITLDAKHVLFRSFYLLTGATGRVQKSDKLRAIIRGGAAQVIFSPNDLLGGLARSAGAVHAFEVVPGGEDQREQLVRLAVNIAMYVLCSDYKNDQVHAPFLMRRRAAVRR